MQQKKLFFFFGLSQFTCFISLVIKSLISSLFFVLRASLPAGCCLPSHSSRRCGNLLLFLLIPPSLYPKMWELSSISAYPSLSIVNQISYISSSSKMSLKISSFEMSLKLTSQFHPCGFSYCSCLHHLSVDLPPSLVSLLLVFLIKNIVTLLFIYLASLGLTCITGLF